MKDISEAPAVRKLVRRLLEKDVQKMCVEWARRRGYWARKFSSQSQRSVPDYLFSMTLLKFACEFKAPGKTSTPAQVDEQNAMRKAGWFVFESDNVEHFTGEVTSFEAREFGHC
jgi:hypothetical protein